MHRTLSLASTIGLAFLAAAAMAQPAFVIDGTVQTTAGGVVFPDLTTQTTAARREFYAGVLVVAKSGGQFTSIQAALDSISNAAADRRYLVWVGPGVYAERITMKPWVDIEGAGPGTTVVTAPGADGGSAYWTVQGAANAALRSLSIPGGFTFAYGILNLSASPELHDLEVSVTGSASFAVGISNHDASPSMSEIEITGVSVLNELLIGVLNRSGSSPAMRHLEISISGPGANAGVYNSDGASPEISFSRIEARGGDSNEGVVNQSEDDPVLPSSPTLRHLRIEIPEGLVGFGVRCSHQSEARLEHLDIEVDTTTTAMGITALGDASPTVLHSRVEAKGATTSRALDLDDGTLEVGNSEIDGPVVLQGTSSITCVGAYDDNFTALDATCQ